MKLREVMKRAPRTVLPDDGLAFARSLMAWGELRHLPVVDDSNHLVGVLSERDVLSFQAHGGDIAAGTVEAAMHEHPRWASPDDSLTEAAARMAEARIGCLPITENGALIGMITTTDVLAAEVRLAFQPEDSLLPRVGDVMTPSPAMVHPDDSLLDAAAQMSQRNIRHLPVVDGDSHILGIVSDRDLRGALGDPRLALERELPDRVTALRVSDVMTQPVITTTADQSCAEAAAAFVRLGASAVPVVDDDDRVIGMVSYVDLLRGFVDAGTLH